MSEATDTATPAAGPKKKMAKKKSAKKVPTTKKKAAAKKKAAKKKAAKKPGPKKGHKATPKINLTVDQSRAFTTVQDSIRTLSESLAHFPPEAPYEANDLRSKFKTAIELQLGVLEGLTRESLPAPTPTAPPAAQAPVETISLPATGIGGSLPQVPSATQPMFTDARGTVAPGTPALPPPMTPAPIIGSS